MTDRIFPLYSYTSRYLWTLTRETSSTYQHRWRTAFVVRRKFPRCRHSYHSIYFFSIFVNRKRKYNKYVLEFWHCEPFTTPFLIRALSRWYAFFRGKPMKPGRMSVRSHRIHPKYPGHYLVYGNRNSL